MPDINLLPWREELREERKRQFFSALVLTAVLAGIIGFAWKILLLMPRNGAIKCLRQKYQRLILRQTR